VDIKNIDADAIKISLGIGFFILILWVLSHIIPVAYANEGQFNATGIR